jgi:NAD-dependent dihydropyrimidine dehydrogenase PreA subunit
VALFIEVKVKPEAAADAATAKKLAEVCPVGIFAVDASGKSQIVEKNVDECTLCELCLAVGKPGDVAVLKLYDDRRPLERHAPA